MALDGFILPGFYARQLGLTAKHEQYTHEESSISEGNPKVLSPAETAPETQNLEPNPAKTDKSVNADACCCGVDTRLCAYCERSLAETYMRDALTFLAKYSWIYDFQLTHLLTDSILQRIPEEWSEYLKSLTCLELNDLPVNPDMPGMPPSLSDFIGICGQLSLPRQACDISPTQLSNTVTKGMNPKKRHEVSRMAALVRDVSVRSNSTLVVDVGAGLGYLSAVVAQHPGLRVLALECREMLTHGTEARGLDQGLSENLEALTFNLQDNEENFHKLRNILSEQLKTSQPQNPPSEKSTEETKTSPQQSHKHSICGAGTSQQTFQDVHLISNQNQTIQNTPTKELSHPGSRGNAANNDCGIPLTQNPTSSSGVCLIGLHCCGSLTPTMIKLFASTPHINSLVCVSCCYHSLQQSGEKVWSHFPMSNSLQRVWKSELPNFNMSVFGLRLAAQETRSRWMSQTDADHIYHRNNVGFRALLQLACDKEGLSIDKARRHIAKKKDMESLDSYIAAVLERTGLGGQCPTIGQKLHALYVEEKDKLDLIEPFTGLQVALQPVLESIILIDRIIFLREAGIDAKLVPIFQDYISPRNMAIVAIK